MKWTPHIPEHGDLRQKQGFLFFPKYIKGQWRWLEFGYWDEVYLYGKWVYRNWLN